MARRPPSSDLTDERRAVLETVCERIGYSFSDLSLLDRALTHASLGNDGRASYERLEFLGDSILGFTVADYLFGLEPEVPEGELTDRRARLVSREPLATVARDLGLIEVLSVGRGLRDSELDSARIQADLVEAVLGAIYVDGGIRPARSYVRRHLLKPAESERRKPVIRKTRDPKSRLLHLAQSHGLGQPKYELLGTEGPDHERVFRVAVKIAGTVYGEGHARSKQAAQMEAAERALPALREYLEELEREDGGA